MSVLNLLERLVFETYITLHSHTSTQTRTICTNPFPCAIQCNSYLICCNFFVSCSFSYQLSNLVKSKDDRHMVHNWLQFAIIDRMGAMFGPIWNLFCFPYPSTTPAIFPHTSLWPYLLSSLTWPEYEIRCCLLLRCVLRFVRNQRFPSHTSARHLINIDCYLSRPEYWVLT